LAFPQLGLLHERMGNTVLCMPQPRP
jgi:hypothetical protein